MIIKNDIPILEYNPVSAELFPPNKGAETLQLPENVFLHLLVMW